MQQTLQSPAVPSLMHVRVSVVQLQALRKMKITLSRRSWLLAMISISSTTACPAVRALWVWVKRQLLMPLIADCARLYVQV